MTLKHTPDAEPAPGAPRLNPGALSAEDAAQVLSRVGGRPITREMLDADLDAGAPANADGTLNLVHYAAWLVREMGQDGG
ncbi:MAG: hypothetical protein IT431_07150 [Phycisphaerales bacterium]|nr:hypothetical protein [Phycisphaerales bacterium]